MRHGSLLSAVILTTAVLLTACSRNPVAPTVDPSAAPGAGTSAVSTVPDDPPPSDGGSPLWDAVQIDATGKSSLSVGRFTLQIRKNSLRMPATITLRVTDPKSMNIQIDVQPPAANDFRQPVLLTADLSDVQGFNYSTGTMMYWSGSWQQATDVTANAGQQNVVAALKQLSNCKVTDGSSNSGTLSGNNNTLSE